MIDFGVAKAISQPLTAKTIFTEKGQLIGTPAYMSPFGLAKTATSDWSVAAACWATTTRTR